MSAKKEAIKIYEGQLALNTFVKDDELKTIEEMKEHEREHANYFEQEIRKRRSLQNFCHYDLLGVGLGFGSTLLGKKLQVMYSICGRSN